MEAEQSDPSEPQPVNEVNPSEFAFAFALRAGEPDDLRFVGESWRRSYSDSNWARCPGGKDEYIATQKAVIAQALATSQVLVAYPTAPDPRPTQILGWVCYRAPSVVHYLFVKPYYRKAGIATALLQAVLPMAEDHQRLAVFTSHGFRRPTGRGDGINAIMDRARRLGVVIEYNPALIFGGHHG